MPNPAYDLPRPDTRPPMYGCGPSYGMLGTSRIVVMNAADYWPATPDRRTLLLNYQGEDSTPFVWQGRWSGTFDVLACQALLTLIDPQTGEWRWSLNFLGLSSSIWDWQGRRTITNFQWQMSGIVIESDFDDSIGQVIRVPEWMTASARWPTLTLPE